MFPDGRTPNLYVNGTLVRTGLRTAKTKILPYLDQMGYSSSSYFDNNFAGGKLSDVGVFRKNFTSEQVQSIANIAVGNDTCAINFPSVIHISDTPQCSVNFHVGLEHRCVFI